MSVHSHLPFFNAIGEHIEDVSVCVWFNTGVSTTDVPDGVGQPLLFAELPLVGQEDVGQIQFNSLEWRVLREEVGSILLG